MGLGSWDPSKVSDLAISILHSKYDEGALIPFLACSRDVGSRLASEVYGHGTQRFLVLLFSETGHGVEACLREPVIETGPGLQGT